MPSKTLILKNQTTAIVEGYCRLTHFSLYYIKDKVSNSISCIDTLSLDDCGKPFTKEEKTKKKRKKKNIRHKYNYSLWIFEYLKPIWMQITSHWEEIDGDQNSCQWCDVSQQHYPESDLFKKRVYLFILWSHSPCTCLSPSKQTHT